MYLEHPSLPVAFWLFLVKRVAVSEETSYVQSGGGRRNLLSIFKNIFTSFTGVIDPYHIPIEEHNLNFSIVTEVFIHKRY